MSNYNLQREPKRGNTLLSVVLRVKHNFSHQLNTECRFFSKFESKISRVYVIFKKANITNILIFKY